MHINIKKSSKFRSHDSKTKGKYEKSFLFERLRYLVKFHNLPLTLDPILSSYSCLCLIVEVGLIAGVGGLKWVAFRSNCNKNGT